MFLLFKKVYAPLYERVQFALADYCTISFPKSGRTWARSFLGNYFSIYFKGEVQYEFCPVLKNNYPKFAPRIFFTHGKHQGENHLQAEKYIKNMFKKKLIFISRRPDKILFSYYFRLQKRMNVSEVEGLDFDSFVRNRTYGIERIVGFMNEWSLHRAQFQSFHIFRYEDFRANPEVEFTKLLDILGVGVDADCVKLAYKKSVDTTKKIEKGGVAADMALLKDISKGDLYFETNTSSDLIHSQYAGNESQFEKVMTPKNKAYIKSHVDRLDAVFNYSL